MAFIRGYERLVFLWFRDIISAWHIARLNRVLRSHFLWTPSAQPGPGNLSHHPSRYALQLVKMAQRYFCPQGDWQGGGDENIPATSRDILLHGSRTPLPLISCPWERFESLFEREMGRGRRNYHRGKSPFFGRLFISSAGGAKNIFAGCETLTLFKPHCAPPVTYLRVTVQIHVQACWKNLTFPNYEFGKG